MSISFYSREQRAKYPHLCGYLATAARVKYPAALQRYKLDTPLLAAGSLIACFLYTIDQKKGYLSGTLKKIMWRNHGNYDILYIL